MQPGYRFSPMDDELLLYYLKPKVNGQPVPGPEAAIGEIDLYGSLEPWQIWELFEPDHMNDVRKYRDLYFFTSVKKLGGPKASRISRRLGTGGGSWKGQGAGTPVHYLDDPATLLGRKKIYKYVNNDKSVHNGSWIMYEYILDHSQITQLANDCVLCMLRCNEEPPKVKSQQQQAKGELKEASVERSVLSNNDAPISSFVVRSDALVVEKPLLKRTHVFNWDEIDHRYSHEIVAEPTLLEHEPTIAQQMTENSAEQPATDLVPESADTFVVSSDVLVVENPLLKRQNLFKRDDLYKCDSHQIVAEPATLEPESTVAQQKPENLALQPETEPQQYLEKLPSDVYGGNLDDGKFGENWMEELLNDDSLISSLAGDNDVALNFEDLRY